MELSVIALSSILAMTLIVMGLAKVQRLPATIQIRDRLRIPPVLWQIMGYVELVAAAGLILGAFATGALAVLAALAAIGSLVTLLVFQLRGREPLAFLVPALVLIAIAAIDIALIVSSSG